MLNNLTNRRSLFVRMNRRSLIDLFFEGAIVGWLIFRGAIAEGCLLDSIEHSNHDIPFPL
jgi:hypothetical protein